LSLEGNGLVRPVTGYGNGELFPYDHQLDPAPAELDVVRFHHSGFDGDPVQPENVVVDGSPWTSEGRLDPTVALELIEPHLHTGHAILGNRGKAIPAHVAMEGLDESLCLIEPAGLELVLTSDLKPIARFTHRGKNWDLPLTDFTVSAALRRTEQPGAHSLAQLGFGKPSRVVLLLSLGTNHHDWHSKLAAGVLLFP
jgi:hypothetical protein